MRNLQGHALVIGREDARHVQTGKPLVNQGENESARQSQNRVQNQAIHDQVSYQHQAFNTRIARSPSHHLDHALAVLLQTDVALKGSKVSSEEQVLASAILTMCAGVRGANAA